MADIDRIDENLAELLTNTVNMTSVFYDIFLNPNPMDVTFQMFNKDNELIDVTIPNRAKDRITPYIGEDSPEGVVAAPIGSVYVDTATSTVYYKVSGEADDPLGWNAVISQSLMETFIRTYLEARGYVTTSSLNTYLVTHEYVNVPRLSDYLEANGYIKSKNLESVDSVALNDDLMILTGETGEELKSVQFGNLISSSVSDDQNNALSRGSDSKLSVSIGDGLSINNSSEVYVKPATADTIGGVKIGEGLTSEADGTISVDVVAGRNVGEVVASAVPLTDAGLHLLDGTLLNGGGIYSAFVDYIADLYDSGDYTDLFETEADWQTAVTTYGVCGKFVYDSVNNTVRLPKITGIIEGTTDATALGDLVQAGLPNITGVIDYPRAGTPSGAFAYSGQRDYQVSGGTGGRFDYANFNASRSSSIYGNSSTVQPQTIKVLYYIVIASSVKTDVELDIDEIVADLELKANANGDNLTPEFSTALSTALSSNARTSFSNLGMPCNTYTSYTWADNNTYTAPADGWFCASGSFSEGGFGIYNITTGLGNSTLNNSGATNTGYVAVPVSKGHVVKVYRTYGGGSISFFRFVRTNGDT